MDSRDDPAIQAGLRIDIDAEADQRDTYGRSFENPRLVRPGIIDCRRLGDAVQYPPARAPPDRLGGDQTSALQPPLAHQLPGFRKPVGNEISFRWHSASKGREQAIHISITE